MLRTGRMLVAGLAMVAIVLASRVSAADPKYFPSDTEIVFTVNIKQILDSELVKSNKDKIEQAKAMIKNAIPGDNQAMKYLEKAGFDPFKDFGSITVAMPPSKDPENVFVLVEGNFNAKKVEEAAKAAAEDHGDVIKINKAGAFKVFEISPPGGQKVYAALLNSTTMAICSSDENMKAAIGRATGAKKNNLKAQISSLLKSTDTKQSISFVATGSGLAKLAGEAGPKGQQAVDALKVIDGLSGAVTIGKDVELMFGVATQSPDTAKDFAAKADFGLKAIRFFAAQQAQTDEKFQPLADAAKTLRASAQGSNLILRGEISYDNIQKLIKGFAGN